MFSIHDAPAVKFPVGRSYFHACLLGALGFLLFGAGLLWLNAVDQPGWRQVLYVSMSLLTWLGAGVAWRNGREGVLGWGDGRWRWLSEGQSMDGMVTVHLDLQFVLLLRLRTDGGHLVWLWPERRGMPARWRALRRAVFGRPSSGLSGVPGLEVRP